MPGTAAVVRVSERGLVPGGLTQDLTKSSKFHIRVIAPGWGSSGYYSAEALKDAAERKIFAAGTHVFLDHPGAEERYDRPERSVRDLAGKLSTDAVMEADGLYAEIEVFPHFAPVIEAMKDDIGMSIRATATVEHGEIEGRSGQIITEFDHAISVDFVTRAGAGGKIIQLIEAARTVGEATANDQRDALDRLVKDAYGADKTWVWVRDFDETTVWFTVDDADSTDTFAQSFDTDDDGVPSALTGPATAVRPVTQYVPVVPAGQSENTEESEEDTMATTQIEESELARLREDAGRVTALESERDKAVEERDTLKSRAETAEATLAKHDLSASIDKVIDAAEAEFTELEKAGLVALAPINEGVLDEAAFAKTVAEHAAKIAEAEGAGSVRGHGRRHGDNEVSEADLDKILNEEA